METRPNNVIVYGTPTCVDCIRSVTLLQQLGVSYHYFDISKDAALARVAAQLNEQAGTQRLTTIPVILVGGRIFSEPSDEELTQALGVNR